MMKYMNPDMLLQDRPAELVFRLHAEKVNSIRYKSKPYDTVRGQVRQFDLYIPREVFLDAPIPDVLVLPIGADV
jgi:hypothetical protein